jgi:hypothetical protein
MGKKDRTRRLTSASAPSPELFDPALLPRSVELLKIAESDRRAADVLHQAQLYPQAVFALQQAVEKTVKAIGLSTRVVSIAELQGAISHRAINVYLMAMRKTLAVGNARMGDQQAIGMLNGLLSTVEGARDRFANTSKPTAAELEQWIIAHRSLRDELGGVLAGPAGIQMLEAVDESITAPLPFAATEIPKRIFGAMSVIAGLYYLCLATLAHAVTPRYGEGDRSPIDIYTAAHPLVARLRDLVEIAGECIEFAQSAFTFVLSWPET